jgi:hypothetical protein
MTCNKAWISSLDWAFFLWFLWTSFNQNMDILRVKLVHKTEQRKASPTMKFKPYCKSCKDFYFCSNRRSGLVQSNVGQWSAFSWVQVWLACRLAFCLLWKSYRCQPKNQAVQSVLSSLFYNHHTSTTFPIEELSHKRFRATCPVSPDSFPSKLSRT